MAIELSEKNRLVLIRLLLVTAALILLVLLFLISPLHDLIFPAQSEQDVAMEDESSALSDAEMLSDERNSGGDEYSEVSLDNSEESAAGSDGDDAPSDDSAAAEEAGSGTEAPTVNRPPVIEEFAIGPVDVMEAVRREEAIPITYEERPFLFNVLASDHEGEVIDFVIDASHGLIVHIIRPDDNTVQFYWISPPNSEGLTERTVNATVEVTAIDFSGGRDRAVINFAMSPESIESAEEPADPGGAFSVARTYRTTAAPHRSGYVNSAGDVRTGTIIIGDDDSNRQYKGYLMFWLDGITDIDPDDITRAQIVFNAVNKSGDPQTVGELVDLKVFNYGPILDSSDFAVGGNRFTTIRTGSFTSGSTAQGTLLDQLRSIRTAGGPTLMIKIGLNCVFRSKPNSDSAVSRTAIPFTTEH